MKIVVVLSLLVLSSCSREAVAVVHNPKTGETAQCQYLGTFHDAVGACVAAYEKLGWEQVR
ncbi:MAG: hypothetical protein JWL84_528 [Rhodospirillales bacterium]|jgi:hypothetical protein|nr:hypothetical protein [Rhodospirillales bacterium]